MYFECHESFVLLTFYSQSFGLLSLKHQGCIMSLDRDFVYGLEVRIIDLEGKVLELERSLRLERQGESDSKGRVLPDFVRERIAAGENPVRVLRTFRLLTQRELSERTGLRENHISAIERGREFGLKTARLLAEALEAPEDVFQRPVPRPE